MRHYWHNEIWGIWLERPSWEKRGTGGTLRPGEENKVARRGGYLIYLIKCHHYCMWSKNYILQNFDNCMTVLNTSHFTAPSPIRNITSMFLLLWGFFPCLVQTSIEVKIKQFFDFLFLHWWHKAPALLLPRGCHGRQDPGGGWRRRDDRLHHRHLADWARRDAVLQVSHLTLWSHMIIGH